MFNGMHAYAARVSYRQNGVDGGNKWRADTRETEVRLDGFCEGGLRQQRMTVEAERQCAIDRKEWRSLVHM